MLDNSNRINGAKMVNTNAVLDKVRSERRELQQALEVFLCAVVDGSASLQEGSALYQKLGMNDRAVQDELSRVRGAKMWKQRAGSNREFAENIETHEALNKSVPKKIESLESRIEKLVMEADDLRAALSIAQSKVESQTLARQQLRNYLPEFISKPHQTERQFLLECESSVRLREVRNRIEVIKKLTSQCWPVTRDNQETIWFHCEGVRDDILQRTQGFSLGPVASINESSWRTYLDELLAELPTLEEEEKELSRWFANALEECDSVLDYYTNGDADGYA